MSDGQPDPVGLTLPATSGARSEPDGDASPSGSDESSVPGSEVRAASAPAEPLTPGSVGPGGSAPTVAPGGDRPGSGGSGGPVDAPDGARSDAGSEGGRPRTAPSVSVVVPVYNDPAGVAATLEALVAQTYGDYEVLVVDNRSTDGTQAVAEAYAERFDHVRAIEERRRQSSYAARVRGVRRADGEVIAFLDADVTVEADWLERAVERLVERDLDYVGCRVELYTEGEESLAAAYNRRNGFRVDTYVSEMQFAPTCALLVRRAVFEAIGPFDTRFVSSGDREFGQRVAAAGFDVGLAEAAPIYHPTRTTLGSLVSKAVRIGRGKYQLRRFYPERYGHPGLLPVHPGLYTPPVRMDDAIRGWDDLDAATRARFYCLAYGLKLAKAFGTLRAAADDALGRSARMISSVPGLISRCV